MKYKQLISKKLIKEQVFLEAEAQGFDTRKRAIRAVLNDLTERVHYGLYETMTESIEEELDEFLQTD